MKIILAAVAVAGIASLTGCANLYPPSSKDTLKPTDSYWFSYDASRRGTLVLAGDQQIRACSEPAPDVALSFVNQFKGAVEAPTGTTATNVDATLNATAMALAGRNDLVLLAREALFRICEGHMNGTIPAGDVKELFNGVFNGVLALAKEQSTTAKAKAQAAVAEAEKANTELKKLQQLEKGK